MTTKIRGWGVVSRMVSKTQPLEPVDRQEAKTSDTVAGAIGGGKVVKEPVAVPIVWSPDMAKIRRSCCRSTSRPVSSNRANPCRSADTGPERTVFDAPVCSRSTESAVDRRLERELSAPFDTGLGGLAGEDLTHLRGLDLPLRQRFRRGLWRERHEDEGKREHRAP